MENTAETAQETLRKYYGNDQGKYWEILQKQKDLIDLPKNFQKKFEITSEFLLSNLSIASDRVIRNININNESLHNFTNKDLKNFPKIEEFKLLSEDQIKQNFLQIEKSKNNNFLNKKRLKLKNKNF